MIPLYLNAPQKQFIRPEKTPLFWGKEADLLPYQDPPPQDYSFWMKQTGAIAGPLIGILVSKSKNSIFLGSRAFYEQIQAGLQEADGGLAFLFSLQDIKPETIEGLCYCKNKGVWLQAVFPYPNIVYNRISSRTEESSEPFHRFASLLKQRKIAFFNPHFLDKYEMYEKFRDNPDIKGHLPETILIREQEDFTEFLSRHKDLYLKPVNKSQGSGILRIILKADGRCQYCSPHSCKDLPSIQALWKEVEKISNNNLYIAQVTIPPELSLDRKYDYRVHAHFSRGAYEITGIGVRMARPGGITTHTSKGGEIVPLAFHIKKHAEQKIPALIQACGKALTKEYGFFGEFTADIGTAPDGSLYLFELNAKPMPFDEVEIEERKIRKLIALFYTLTNDGEMEGS